jgi:hypothetical protein
MQLRFHLTRAAIALTFALATSFASSAIADTNTEKVGKPNGTPFEAKCPPNQAMVGWAYNYGDSLLAIGPMCESIANGQLSGQPPVASPKTVFGASSGSTGGEGVVCKPEYGAVESISVVTGPDLRVLSIRATCRPFVGSGHGGSLLTAPMKTTGAIAPGGKSGVGCGNHVYATGFVGSFIDGGPHPGIQSLGLICHDDADNTPPPPPQNADNGDDQDNGDQVNVDNGNGDDGNGDGNGNGNGITINGLPFQIQINLGPGQNGINFGPKGKLRTANDDTTIYSDKGNTEIAYLQRGQKVLVIGCEKKGKGWCQIAKPTPGLVWGGDLK